MNSTKVLIKNLFSLSVAEFLSRGIQFFYYIYLIRIIKPEGNGIHEFSRSLAQYFLILVTLGFDQVGIREGARDKSKIKVYADTIIAIRLSIAVACYILLFFLAVFLKYNGTISSEEEIAIFIHGSILLSMALQPQWVFQAIEKMEIIALRMTIVNALNFIGIIIFVQSRSDLLLAISILMISQFLTSVWIFVHYSKHYGLPKPSMDFGFWKLIIRQAFTIGIIFMIVTAYNNLDITMLRLLLPEEVAQEQTGIFGAALKLAHLLLIPAAVLQTGFFPRLSRAETKEERSAIVKRFAFLLLFIGALIGYSLFLFSDFIVSILGADFAKSGNLLKYLSISTFLTYSSIIFFASMISWNRERVVVYSNIAGLAMNIILNVTLIPVLGMYGAVIATIGSELAVLVVLTWLFYRITGNLYIFEIVKFLFFGLISFIPALLLIDSGINEFLLFGGTAVLYTTLHLFVFKTITISEIRGIIKI